MKKMFKIVVAIAAALVIASLCFAQTGQMEKKADMTSDMSSLMNDVSGMMVKMAALSTDVSPENRKKMATVLSNLSKEMTNMSNMVGSGKMTDRELEKMHVRLMKTQRMLSEMEMKK